MKTAARKRSQVQILASAYPFNYPRSLLGPLNLRLLEREVQRRYDWHERRHAGAILRQDFREEWKDILEVLDDFSLPIDHVLAEGGGKSPISAGLDASFNERGWIKKQFDSEVVLDGTSRPNPTHEIDCYKNRVALEVEWSNKDPFFDRDLNNFRILFELDAISVGVIVTKAESLKTKFKELKLYGKFGASTTWMGKLLPRLDGGGAGGCPVLAVGITGDHLVP